MNMKTTTLALGVASFFMLTACGGEKKETEQAEVRETKEGDVANEYKLNADESTISWEGSKKIGDSHKGTVKIKSGELVYNEGELVGGTFTIDMTTINDLDLKDPEKNAKLVGHLKSDDFFGVEENPEAKFVIAKVKEGKIIGNLSLKDSTNKETVSYTVEEKEGKKVYKGSTTIDRTIYGAHYGSSSIFDGLGDKAINDEIKLDITIVADKKETAEASAE
jgi:polyisoprenoid-binding protein YceI